MASVDMNQGDGRLLRTILDTQGTDSSASATSSEQDQPEPSRKKTPRSGSSESESSDSESTRSVSYQSSDSSDDSGTIKSDSSDDSENDDDTVNGKEERVAIDTDKDTGDTLDNADVENVSSRCAKDETEGVDIVAKESESPRVVEDAQSPNDAVNDDNQKEQFNDFIAINTVVAANSEKSQSKPKKPKRKRSKSAKYRQDVLATGSLSSDNFRYSKHERAQRDELAIDGVANRRRRRNEQSAARGGRRKTADTSPVPVSSTLYQPEPASNDDKLHIKYLELMSILRQTDRRAFRSLQSRVVHMYGEKVNKFMPVESYHAKNNNNGSCSNYVRVHGADDSVASTDRSSNRDEFVFVPSIGKKNSRSRPKTATANDKTDRECGSKPNLRRSRSNLEAKYKHLQDLLTEQFKHESESLIRNQLKQTIDVVKHYQEELCKIDDRDDAAAEEAVDEEETGSIDRTDNQQQQQQHRRRRNHRRQSDTSDSGTQTPRSDGTGVNDHNDDENDDVFSKGSELTSSESSLSASKRVTFSDGNIEVSGRSNREEKSDVGILKRPIIVEVNGTRPRVGRPKRPDAQRVRSPEKTNSGDSNLHQRQQFYGSDHRLADTDNESILIWLKEKNKLQKQQRKQERAKKRKERQQLAEKAADRLERESEAHDAMLGWMKRKRHEEQLLKKRKKKEKERLRKTEESTREPEETSNRLKTDLSYNSGNSADGVNRFEADRVDSRFRDGPTNAEIASKLSHGGRPRSSYTYKSVSQKKAAKLAMEEEKRRRDELLKKRIAYDQWLKAKAEEAIRQRRNEKKKEAEEANRADPEYVKIIPDLAKNRCEKIDRNKKRIDTGLPEIDRRANSYPRPKRSDQNQEPKQTTGNYIWKEPKQTRPPSSSKPRSPRTVKSRDTPGAIPTRHCIEIPDQIAENTSKPPPPNNKTRLNDLTSELSPKRPSSAPSDRPSSGRRKWTSPTPLRQSTEQGEEYSEYINDKLNVERPEPQGCDRPEEPVCNKARDENGHSDESVPTPPPTPPGKKKVSFGASKLVYTMDDTPSSGSSDVTPPPEESGTKRESADNDSLSRQLDDVINGRKDYNETDAPLLNNDGFFITSLCSDEDSV
ncbi:uncharacterized protein LOC141912702 [Tubulanus polymorphus]|uniref:uncharacterized protein LOC141912702 n=1 Tax=Tubulanus polymorphus TaxID=672921 RepID=UPI003DA5129D